MKKSKFNILFEEVINSLNTNAIDQEYFNNCHLLVHDQPVKYKDLFIQIFDKNSNSKDIVNCRPYYFAYILDEYGVVKYILRQVYLDKEECLIRAKLFINDEKKFIPNENQVRIRKTEEQFCHKPHTRKYGFFNKKSQTEFLLTEEQLNIFMSILNENNLVQEYKAQYNKLLSQANSNNKFDLENLIDEKYTIINLHIIKSPNLPGTMVKVIFRLILPYTKLNWFNKIFRETLEIVRNQNNVIKENNITSNNTIDYSDLDTNYAKQSLSPAQERILSDMISWIKKYDILRAYFPGYLDVPIFKAKYINKIGIQQHKLPTDKSKLCIMSPLPYNLQTNYPNEIIKIIVSFKNPELNNNSYIFEKFNNLHFSNRYGYVILITDINDIQEI